MEYAGLFAEAGFIAAYSSLVTCLTRVFFPARANTASANAAQLVSPRRLHGTVRNSPSVHSDESHVQVPLHWSANRADRIPRSLPHGSLRVSTSFWQNFCVPVQPCRAEDKYFFVNAFTKRSPSSFVLPYALTGPGSSNSVYGLVPFPANT